MSGGLLMFFVAAPHKAAAAEVTALGNHILTPRQLRRAGRPELPPPATETAKNARIRIARRDVWWRADRTTEYWRARMDWQHALEIAEMWGIADSDSFPSPRSDISRLALVDKWREAVAKQLLTPASDLAAITWKRAKLAGGGFSHLPVRRERVERAIADDVAFLAAHPARRSNSEAMAKRREFNEAMRQRIRKIATTRNLSDEEIKPVLRLKHQEIARFSETHGVNIGWLLEGTGPISLA
jgi:hypothetical protein